MTAPANLRTESFDGFKDIVPRPETPVREDLEGVLPFVLGDYTPVMARYPHRTVAIPPDEFAAALLGMTA